ncbi:hypothetical protein ABT324_30785 [Saccharopolyspora sp. NPDC000359]|uniref:hypothetical protein n=1 Tax=Saccharopolyspora sp. NPDC000359 TaxID=3154251 RepID=UPI00331D434A
MPVRTGRGRAAVYRKAWGWPLRSGRHLAVAIMGLAVAGTAVATVVPDAAQPPAPDPASTAPPPSITSPSPRPTPALTRDDPPTQPSDQDVTEALAAAVDFAARWVERPPGMTSRQFGDQLAPLASPELLIELADVDPARVPQSKLLGSPRAVSARPQLVEAELPTDAGLLHLTMVQTSEGWRVHRMEST